MQTIGVGIPKPQALSTFFSPPRLPSPFVNVILDIEYARAGSIRLGIHDQVLVNLRDSMR